MMSHLFTHCAPYVYDEARLVILYLPKVASSSITQVLKRTVYRNVADMDGLRELRSAGYEIACFVREPMSRLLSAWRYFVPRIGPGDGHHIVPGFTSETPFDEFVRLVLDYDPARLNIHVRPQSLLLSDGPLDLPGSIATRLMKLEDADEEWSHLQSDHGLALPALVRVNRTSGSPVGGPVSDVMREWSWNYEALGYNH